MCFIQTLFDNWLSFIIFIVLLICKRLNSQIILLKLVLNRPEHIII